MERETKTERKSTPERSAERRRVLVAEDWTTEELERLRSMKVPEEYAPLDGEFEGWEPPAE